MTPTSICLGVKLQTNKCVWPLEKLVAPFNHPPLKNNIFDMFLEDVEIILNPLKNSETALNAVNKIAFVPKETYTKCV